VYVFCDNVVFAFLTHIDVALYK